MGEPREIIPARGVLLPRAPGAGKPRIERLSYVLRRTPEFPFEPEKPFSRETAPP